MENRQEMRMKHMGSACNLLVCLEQGPPLELCKRCQRGHKRALKDLETTGDFTSIS